MAGDPSHAASAGPVALTCALRDAGHELEVRRVSVAPFGGDVRPASEEVGRRVAAQVRSAVSGGGRPLVLSGSCDVAPAVVAGLGAADLGVVWIDAHADFNTPESSASGFVPGMALAAVVGDWAWSASGWQAVSAERVALMGVRSLSPAVERERLARSPVEVVEWRAGSPLRPPSDAIARLAERADRVYLHLDLDALDPEVASGVVDPVVPGGLTAEQLDEVLELVARRFPIAGATIATFAPTMDDGSTKAVALAAAERILAAPR